MQKKNHQEKNRSKVVEPVIYALLFRNFSKDSNFIWQVAAYSLDEAIETAKRQAQKELGSSVNINKFKLDLYGSRSIEEFYEDFDSRHPELEKKDEVSSLMKRIVDENDTSLFEKSKKLFSKTQIKYLIEKLKK